MKESETESGVPHDRQPIDEAEARRILANLARNGPPTAQVASIKVLHDMDKAAKAEEEARRESVSYEDLHPELYEDELRRAARGKETDGLVSPSEKERPLTGRSLSNDL